MYSVPNKLYSKANVLVYRSIAYCRLSNPSLQARLFVFRKSSCLVFIVGLLPLFQERGRLIPFSFPGCTSYVSAICCPTGYFGVRTIATLSSAKYRLLGIHPMCLLLIHFQSGYTEKLFYIFFLNNFCFVTRDSTNLIFASQ